MLYGSEHNPMHPRPTAPIPLSADFYKPYVEGQISVPLQPQNAPNRSTATYVEVNPQPIAERLMRENEEFIEKEVMKQAGVTSATTIQKPQYKDLIPLSFDEEAFIAKEEAQRQIRREKNAAQTLRKST
ncbi:unnamed protein product, partial [Mesorhabditis spiculigera]